MSRRFALGTATACVIGTLGLFVIAQPNLILNAATQPPAGIPAAAAPATNALDGTWELVSLIEDGRVIPLDIVRKTMIQDARVIIKGPIAAITLPNGKLRSLAFVTNPNTSPKTLDIAGATRIGGRGIYMQDGDNLLICTRGSDSESRPAMLASVPNSDTFLMSFRRVKAPMPAELPPPPPPAPPLPVGDAMARMLVGTWGHQKDDQVVKTTFNADGTFHTITTYNRGFRKVFDREDRSSGTWRLKDGTVTLNVTASTQGQRRGQNYSYRITSISDSEVLYVESTTGQRRIEWKLR